MSWSCVYPFAPSTHFSFSTCTTTVSPTNITISVHILWLLHTLWITSTVSPVSYILYATTIVFGNQSGIQFPPFDTVHLDPLLSCGKLVSCMCKGDRLWYDNKCLFPLSIPLLILTVRYICIILFSQWLNSRFGIMSSCMSKWIFFSFFPFIRLSLPWFIFHDYDSTEDCHKSALMTFSR
jgi:hypothetical protein